MTSPDVSPCTTWTVPGVRVPAAGKLTEHSTDEKNGDDKEASHDMRLLGAALTGWAVTATLLALRTPWQVSLVTAVSLAAGAVALLIRGRLTLALACIVSALLTASVAWEEARATTGPVVTYGHDRATATIEAVTTGGARKLPVGRFDDTPRFSIPAVVTTIDARGAQHDVRTPVTLIVPPSWAHTPWRSHITARVRMAPSERLGQARAVAVVTSLTSGKSAPAATSAPLPMRVLEAMRQRFSASMTKLPDDAAGLVPALVAGDTSRMPQGLNDDMNATGMSHLNAVSGSNITIVLVAVMWLLQRTLLPRRARVVVALGALTLYMGLCHPDPSVIRAAAMGAVGVLGTSAGRVRAACPALGAAIVLLLGYSPWLAVNAGFALSALATLGLILFATPWATAMTRRCGGRGAKVWEMLMIPLAAQTLCLPILVVLSGSLSLISIPANVVAEPLVAPATLAGMGVLLLAQVLPGLASWAAWLPGLPACGIAEVAHTSADIPGGNMAWPDGWPGVILAAFGVLTGLTAWRLLRYAGWWGLLATGAVLMLPLSFFFPRFNPRTAESWLMALCDVGQGDALVVRTSQSAVLIDTGPPESRPDKCLDRLGVTHLDAIVLTHFHADHVGALARVLPRTNSVMTTWVTEDSGDMDDRSARRHGEQGMKPSVDRQLAQERISAISLARGDEVTIGGVTLKVLWPGRVIHAGSVQNNASVLLDVSSADLHALLLADAEKEAESAITSAVQDAAKQHPYDVVKVAHHGSSNQSAGIYSAASATYAAISVGRDNDYGHPTKKLLRMLERAQSLVVRTDQCGTIIFVADAGGIRLHDDRCAEES